MVTRIAHPKGWGIIFPFFQQSHSCPWYPVERTFKFVAAVRVTQKKVQPFDVFSIFLGARCCECRANLIYCVLIRPEAHMTYIWWITWVVGGLAVLLLATLFITAWMAKEYFSLKGHFDPTEDLIGQFGTVKRECTPHKRGKVYVAGAYWDAVSVFGALHEGDDIKVIETKEKFLIVSKVDLIDNPTSVT